MADWNEIQTEMAHISQFRNLTSEDWDRLCRTIKKEIVEGTELKGASQREAFLDKLEQRKTDRRKNERRDFSQLKSLTDEDWDKLCKAVQEAKMTRSQERRLNKRRADDR